MIDRVRRALRPSGGLNALTPLDTASSPVSDEPPLANALASTYTAPRLSRPCPLPAWNCPGRLTA